VKSPVPPSPITLTDAQWNTLEGSGDKKINSEDGMGPSELDYALIDPEDEDKDEDVNETEYDEDEKINFEGKDDLQRMHDELEKARSKTEDGAGDVQHVQTKLDEVNKKIINTAPGTSVSGDLINEKFQLETMLRSGKAFSGDAINRIFDISKIAAEMAKKHVTEKNGTAAIDTYINFLDKERKNIQLTKIYGKPEFDATCNLVSKLLFAVCTQDGVPKNVFKKISNVDAINAYEEAWKPSKSSAIMINNNGAPVKFCCTQIPAPSKAAIECGHYGVTSNERNSPYLINSWISSVSAEDSHGQSPIGEKQLDIIRHGNTRGGHDATKELLALTLHPSIISADLSGKIALGLGTSPGNPIPITLSNIQLMTPNAFGKADCKMPMQQMKTIRKFVNIPTKISFRDPKNPDKFIERYVKLGEPLLFNFGCNWQHFSPVSKIFSDSDEENKKSMVKLFGENVFSSKNNNAAELQKFYESTIKKIPDWINFKEADKLFGSNTIVGKYLMDDANSPKNKKIVLQLAAQIVKIWNDNAHNKNPTNPYAMQERILYLSHMLNYVPSVNCKSGKDRTGMVCAAVNALGARIKMNGDNPDVPEAYAAPSAVDKANNSTMLNASGSPQITASATGYQGLKIKTSPLCANFKPSDIFGTVTGASHLAKS
jgi:phosphatidylinositol-4,5-bisphosphate 4-phosphatase